MDKLELHSYAVSLISHGGARGRPGAIIHARSGTAAGPAADVYLRFYRPDVVPPSNRRVVGEDGKLMLVVAYPYEQLAAAVDLLRHEKPVYFSFDERRETGYLATGDEPVGEGEQDADFGRA
ncbi:MAG: hypothetical protein HY744_29975 [Deltaproteobacteria bacterium]|nr:hypothetical protein [Deltaproteobacteria bacterium]